LRKENCVHNPDRAFHFRVCNFRHIRKGIFFGRGLKLANVLWVWFDEDWEQALS
jgi:hypothetical protein